MLQKVLADIRFSCNVPSNSSAAIARAVRLGHSRVLAEAIYSPPRKGQNAGSVVFAPHHIPEYQELWQAPLSDWMIQTALDRGLDYPDELGTIRKEVLALEELWVLCRLGPAQLDGFLDALSLEHLGEHRRTVFVLPEIHAAIDMPYPVCSFHRSATIRLCRGLSLGVLMRRLSGGSVFCLEENFSWATYRREVVP